MLSCPASVDSVDVQRIWEPGVLDVLGRLLACRTLQDSRKWDVRGLLLGMTQVEASVMGHVRGRTGGDWVMMKLIDAISQVVATPLLGDEIEVSACLERSMYYAPDVKQAEALRANRELQEHLTRIMSQSDAYLLRQLDIAPPNDAEEGSEADVGALPSHYAHAGGGCPWAPSGNWPWVVLLAWSLGFAPWGISLG